MIRVAFLDDHAAVRAGLEAFLAPEPDLESVGFADDEEQLWSLLQRTRPSVVVVDLHHPGHDGLTLSQQIRRDPHAPSVVLYSARTDAAIAVAAAVAGANAVVSKSRSNHELLEAIRVVAREPRTMPAISRRMRASAAARLDPADHAILAMRLAGEPPAEIADTLWVSVAEIHHRIAAIVDLLGPSQESSERPQPSSPRRRSSAFVVPARGST